MEYIVRDVPVSSAVSVFLLFISIKCMYTILERDHLFSGRVCINPIKQMVEATPASVRQQHRVTKISSTSSLRKAQTRMDSTTWGDRDFGEHAITATRMS